MELKRGFSLIELVVVITLLGLLTLAISSTMLMSVMSSNRIKTTTAVKQAGGYAISQIQSMLRNARSVTCSSSPTSVNFQNIDGGTTTILLESSRIASNSGIYLTPANSIVSSFALTCLPDNTTPTLVKISFDLKNSLSTARATENPLLHFETSINLRNE